MTYAGPSFKSDPETDSSFRWECFCFGVITAKWPRVRRRPARPSAPPPRPLRPTAPEPTQTPQQGEGRRTFQRACLPRSGPVPRVPAGNGPRERPHAQKPFPALAEPSISVFFTWFLKIRRRVITGTEKYSRIAKCTSVRVCVRVSAQMCTRVSLCARVCTCVGARVCLSRAENRPGGLREVVQGGGQVPPPPPSSGLAPPPPPPARPPQPYTDQKSPEKQGAGLQLTSAFHPGVPGPVSPAFPGERTPPGGQAPAGDGHLPTGSAGSGGCGQR